MAADNSSPRRGQRLAGWAEVDPTRHPFDPAGVPAVVRSLAPPVPPAVPAAVPPLGGAAWSEYRAAREAALQWNVAMTDAFVGHNAAGLPEQRSVTLVDRALDARFDG